MKIEKRKIIKAIAVFLGIMAVFTFVSVKVDYYMTNEVQLVQPQRGALSFQIDAVGTAAQGEAVFALDLTQESYLKEGDNLQLIFPNIPNDVTAAVRQKTFDPETQTVSFTCRLIGSLKLYDGQICAVHFQYPLGEYNLLLPRECVRQSGTSAYVYVVETRHGTLGSYELVQQVPVTVLETDEFYAAVEAPLNEGSQVVRSSAKPLQHNQKVRSQP